MHELGLTQGILDIAIEHAEKNNASRILQKLCLNLSKSQAQMTKQLDEGNISVRYEKGRKTRMKSSVLGKEA